MVETGVVEVGGNRREMVADGNRRLCEAQREGRVIDFSELLILGYKYLETEVISIWKQKIENRKQKKVVF